MTTFAMNPTNSYTEEGRRWYDIKMGIRASIGTLHDFLGLVHERYQAGYVRKEKLNQLYVLGDYSLDTCGNCSVASPSVKKLYPHIPDVLTHEEYWEFMKKDSKGQGVSFSYGKSMPSEMNRCPFCQKGWSIANIGDVVTKEKNIDIDLLDFIGKSLGEVKNFYVSKVYARYRISGEPFLHNDRFIDLSPWTLNPKTDFEKTMVKNENGWVGSKDGITDNYIIGIDDTINFSVIQFFHSNCNREYLEINQRDSFLKIFLRAGFRKIDLQSIPNEYCPCEVCAPWFNVTTDIGMFKIGWRKQVINIDWSNLGKSLLSLFEEEKVTKGESGIHAWGDKKAVEYLTKIRDFCKEK